MDDPVRRQRLNDLKCATSTALTKRAETARPWNRNAVSSGAADTGCCGLVPELTTKSPPFAAIESPATERGSVASGSEPARISRVIEWFQKSCSIRATAGALSVSIAATGPTWAASTQDGFAATKTSD